MAGAFQASCFQDDAFQIARDIASTANLQLPVNCVLAGAALLDERKATARKPGMRARQLGTNRLSCRALRNTFNE